MLDFISWILAEASRSSAEWVPSSVLLSYDHAFKQELMRLIQRTANPTLRAKFEEMLKCPIRDTRGNCRQFSDYIVAALVKNGVHRLYDVEAALAYVFEKMMLDKSDAGEPRTTVFGGFEDRPGATAVGNPLQARFMKYLEFAIKNIARGKIARLSAVERRPPGTVSIAQGRQKDGDPVGGISADKIAARPSSDSAFEEMLDDITTLLRRKEPAYGLPLADFFTAMMGGARTGQQGRQFGDRPMKAMRAILKQTVADYAEKTGNYLLLNMLKRYEDFQSNRPMEPSRKPAKTVRPKLSDRERDYGSILAVVDRLGRPAGSADFGKARRRWLEYPPRNPDSGHRDRLQEVLADMVRDGVLRADRTTKGAFVYSPGPNAEAYRQGVPT